MVSEKLSIIMVSAVSCYGFRSQISVSHQVMQNWFKFQAWLHYLWQRSSILAYIGERLLARQHCSSGQFGFLYYFIKLCKKRGRKTERN